MLDIAYVASMEPEEGRFATFSIAFVSPEQQSPFYKRGQFTEGIELSTSNVVRLASATDPTVTSLALWRDGRA